MFQTTAHSRGPLYEIDSGEIMNHKKNIKVIKVYLYVLGILSSISIVSMFIMKYLGVEPMATYVESLTAVSISRSLGLAVLLLLSAWFISKKVEYTTIFLIIYLILSIVPIVVLQLENITLSLGYILNFLRYITLLIIIFYLNRFKYQESNSYNRA